MLLKKHWKDVLLILMGVALLWFASTKVTDHFRQIKSLTANQQVVIQALIREGILQVQQPLQQPAQQPAAPAKEEALEKK